MKRQLAFQASYPFKVKTYRVNYRTSRFLNFSVSAGTIWNKSPTTPQRASLSIGTSASLLMATMTLVVRLPAWRWIARDAARDVQATANGLARLADLVSIRNPARVHRSNHTLH